MPAIRPAAPQAHVREFITAVGGAGARGYVFMETFAGFSIFFVPGDYYYL